MKKITFIGSGNVASNLSIELRNKGYEIVEVWSKSENSAKKLSKKLNCNWSADLKKLKYTHLFIVSIKDDFIEHVISQIQDKKTPIIHTSGSIGLDVFEENSSFGVLYPLQSFNKEMPSNFKEVPICIESNDKNLEKDLYKMGSHISESVHLINSYQRQILHLSAVFACNFSNHMIRISEEILKENSLDFNLLKPLIYNTINRIHTNSPKKTQTGPAIREDYRTIEKHIELLKDNSQLKRIYSEITDNIIKNK